MLLLYSGVEEILRKAEKMAPKLLDLPFVSEVKIKIIFLGTISNLAEIELKSDKKTPGWLYTKDAIVFFIHNDQLYEVFISTLKETAEDKLSAKKFIADDESPSPGALKRNSGRIVGYLSAEDLISISNKTT